MSSNIIKKSIIKVNCARILLWLPCLAVLLCAAIFLINNQLKDVIEHVVYLNFLLAISTQTLFLILTMTIGLFLLVNLIISVRMWHSTYQETKKWYAMLFNGIQFKYLAAWITFFIATNILMESMLTSDVVFPLTILSQHHQNLYGLLIFNDVSFGVFFVISGVLITVIWRLKLELKKYLKSLRLVIGQDYLDRITYYSIYYQIRCATTVWLWPSHLYKWLIFIIWNWIRGLMRFATVLFLLIKNYIHQQFVITKQHTSNSRCEHLFYI